MDVISLLHDDLLVKVLSFLPTKVAVSTSILSKRWQFLWMWLPKLDFDCYKYSKSEAEMLRSFINLNLPLHKAPVSFCLRNTKRPIKPEDIELWVGIAVSRCLRELTLRLFDNWYGPTKLSSSLYTCKSLVILKLEYELLVDVPRVVYLPSLKSLVLQYVDYSDEQSLNQLLSNCPVLEDLVVKLYGSENSKTLSIIVPSLQRLTLKIINGNNSYPVVINTPSLKYLQFSDFSFTTHSVSYSLDVKDMPKLEEAKVDLTFDNNEKFFRSIRFVKRLSLWVDVDTKEDVYHDGIIFNQLEHLKLRSPNSIWSKGLFRLLKNSPNLRELEIYLYHGNDDSWEDLLVSWHNHDLDCVPQCLLGSLQSFKLEGIYGSEKEIDLVKYILRNVCCLKTATILFLSSPSPEEEFKIELMKKELPLYFRGSTTCQLVFS